MSHDPETIYRVLVVDDEALDGDAVADALNLNIERNGSMRFEAVSIQDPAEMDAACDTFVPDALVLDIDFTTLDRSAAARDLGLDLLEQVTQLRLKLGRKPFELPVVVMSGRLAEGDPLREPALTKIKAFGAFFVEKAGHDAGVGRIIAALEERLGGGRWPAGPSP